MINLDSIVNTNNEKHNEKWPYMPDHPYRILIIGGSESGKTNTLLNLIHEQRDIDKIYLYAKDLSQSKYEHLIKNRENPGIKHLNDSKGFIECSNTMDDVYENIDLYNQSYFSVPKDVRLNSIHYFIMKINNKRELQNITINHSADIDYKDFIKIYRECTKEPYNFLTIDTTLPSNNPLRFRKKLFDTL